MAQNLILCQLCEKPKEIRWKCFICDLVLCEKCVKKHSKFGGSVKHCVINLKQVGIPENVDIIRKFNLKNIRCTSHEEEKCSLFCKECKNPVCSFCVLEPEHKGHNLDKLSTVYNNQLSELKDMKKEIEKALPDLTKSMRETTTTCDNYNEIKQKIIQHEKELQTKVAEEAANLINKLDKLVIPSKDAFMEEKQRIQNKEIKLKEMNNKITTALQSHQATGVLDTIDKEDRYLPLKPNSDNIPLDQKFKWTIPNSSSINFGTVKKCPIFKFINTYEVNIPYIKKLKSLKDGTLVCISVKEAGYFVGNFDEQGDMYFIKNEICITDDLDTLTDMTVTEDDKILTTEAFDGILCKHKYSKQLTSFKIRNNHFGNNVIYRNGIHSFDQKILLGFEEFWEYPNPFSEFPGTGVMILNENGYCLKTLWNTERDSDIHMLRGIDKLTTNKRGDVIIIDGHINLTIFDSQFKFKWTYRHLQKLVDIVTRPNGQIVVADIDSILVLSIEGDFLNFLNSIGEEDGIHHPTCVHIDNSGQLLVGCKVENNTNAKIHVIKILD